MYQLKAHKSVLGDGCSAGAGAGVAAKAQVLLHLCWEGGRYLDSEQFQSDCAYSRWQCIYPESFLLL